MRGMSKTITSSFAVVFSLVLASAAPDAIGDDGQRLLTIDHYVRVASKVPAMAGGLAQIYVREKVGAGLALRGPAAPDRVVLFIHGAGTPAEVAFDTPAGTHSWMAFLAQAGFDVFAMDMEGYGRSSRPGPMQDPCNLAEAQQAQFIPALLATPCKPTYPGQLTSLGSDWHDIDAVVDHIRKLRGVAKVSLVSWSLGGPRAGGYAAQHPDKVHRLVLFAPAYNRTAAPTAPTLPAPGVVFNTQSRSEFIANWDRQVGCPNQYEPAVRDAVWSEMLASDPIGATWGTGVRRAPSTTTWGWNAAAIGGTKNPTLVIAGALDKQVTPERVKPAFDDLGATDKVLVDLACSSHNAMWEKNHLLMFQASLDWLTKGSVGEQKSGVVRLGY
jgi:pimeloyl-ACP methyl ester carboxylesterase